MESLSVIARTMGRPALVLARWLPRWLPGMGLLLLALAAVFAAGSWWHNRMLLHATATVTENVAAFAPGGGVVYRPRLRFRTPSGDNAQVVIPQGRDEPEFAAGTNVAVAWPSGEPERAVIATVWRVYRFAIGLAILGTVLFDLGWILRLRSPHGSGR
jgi:hypothetical protein